MSIKDHLQLLFSLLGMFGLLACVLVSAITLVAKRFYKGQSIGIVKDFLTGLLLFSTLCFIVVLCNDWLDVLTGKVHHYDSRRKDNVEHFSMPCYLFDQKRNSVNLDLFFSLDSFKSICKDLEI